MGNPATILQWIGSPIGVAVFVVVALLLVVRKRRLQKHVLPATSTNVGRTLARRTSVIRVVVVLVLLVVYIGAAISLPRDPASSNSRESLPNASSGILVVDVSGSIGERNKQTIIAIFEEAVERKLNLGLVIFAGEGYLVWGPNVPAEESLEQMKRFFEIDEESGRPLRLEPWTLGGGTEIYEGLLDAVAAREILVKRGFSNTPIILVSDLQDQVDSKANTIKLIAELKSKGVPVWIIQMGTSSKLGEYTSTVAAPYVKILGEEAFISDLSVLESVSITGSNTDEGMTAYAAETVFGLLAAALLLLILVDAFVLPRLPVEQLTEREEE